MKAIKLIVVFVLLGAAGVSSAWADRGHVHFGVTVGPYWGPWYYPPPAYYYPPPYAAPIVVERAPPVYVEQQPSAPPVHYWYYCAPAKAYYPYVKNCPSGWQRVSPQPPPGP